MNEFEHAQLSSFTQTLCVLLPQSQYERAGALMGGGRFVAPVQRVTDFLGGKWCLAAATSVCVIMAGSCFYLHSIIMVYWA